MNKQNNRFNNRIVAFAAILFVFCAPSDATSQLLPKGNYIETSLHAGQPIKHRSSITVDLSKPSFGAELNYEVQTYGKKHWHQRCGYPRWGVALSYQHSGNGQQMGSGIGILPNITVDFIRKPKFRLFGRMAVGLAVMTKPYHRINNPENNIIGSYVNNNTAFRVGAAWRIGRHFEFRPSATFTHYSNAASQLPNLGINVPTLQFGLCYMPNAVESTDYIRYPKILRTKTIQFSAVTTVGFREMETSGGAKYGIAQVSVDAGYYITTNNRLKIGVEYDYLGNVYSFIANNGGFEGKDLSWLASRVSVFIADEIMIGRFSVGAQVGIYLTQNPLQPWFMSLRFSGRYYLVDPYFNRVAPFLTVTMKSHRIVAEYFSVGIGSAF